MAVPPSRNSSAPIEPRYLGYGTKNRVAKSRRALRPLAGELPAIPSGRTAEGRRLREFRAALIEHCGGQPSVTQLALINRATMLEYRLTALDREPAMTDYDHKRYLGWSNAQSRLMRALGLEGPGTRPLTPQENWKRFQAAQAASAQPDDE